MKDAAAVIFCKALVCLFCVCLSGCMHAVPKDRIAAMKKVGVVSFLGDSVELREEKLLPPGFASSPFRIPSWKIDQYARALVVAEIERQKIISVIPFEYDHEVLWKANFDGPDIAEAELRPILRNDLSEIARRNDLDTLIIVYAPPRRAVTAPHQILPFCLYRYYGLSGKSVSYYMLAWIRVLDGKSLETLGLKAFYYRESLDSSLWPPFTDAGQLMTLEKRTKDILGQKLPLRMKEIGFGGSDK
jgi:hypothetical protein